MPTISVLINCFNYKAFVVEAVQSALNQTRKPDQIVVVDDGSTDGSTELLRSTFSGNTAVEIITQRNSGQLAAMVAGFQQSIGDIIFFLDADDRYQPSHLAEIEALYVGRKDIDFIFTGMAEFGERKDLQLFYTRDHYLASSVIRTLNDYEWLGAATSAISCRRWVMDAMLPVLLNLVPLWRIRADDCIVRGSSAVGARKFFRAAPTVDYRVHGTNAFANRALDLAHHRQHRTKTICLVNHFSDHVGLRPELISRAHLEFELIPEPRTYDFAGYWYLIKASRTLSWLSKLRMWLHMRRHFFRHGQKE